MAEPTLTLTSRIPLSNSLSIPRIHLGVYLMSSREAGLATTAALEAGYRAVDSAQMYRNEAAVGKSIAAFLHHHPDVRREDVHYTTKLARNGAYEQARRSVKQSVEVSGLGYVDLFLLHSPYGGKRARLESWRALEDAVRDGEVRSIGVSNFGEKHVSPPTTITTTTATSRRAETDMAVKIDELLASSPKIKPAVNQIEVHPFNTRTSLVSHCQRNNIVVQAYAPLARALRMEHPTIVSLSQKYGCTPAQLMVRWSLQKGYVPLPKSVRRERIVENAQVSGFEVEEGDVKTMDGLDEYLVTGQSACPFANVNAGSAAVEGRHADASCQTGTPSTPIEPTKSRRCRTHRRRRGLSHRRRQPARWKGALGAAATRSTYRSTTDQTPFTTSRHPLQK